MGKKSDDSSWLQFLQQGTTAQGTYGESYLLIMKDGKSKIKILTVLELGNSSISAPFIWISLWGTRGKTEQVFTSTCFLSQPVSFIRGLGTLSHGKFHFDP